MSITSVRSRPGFTLPGEFTWPDDFARIPDEEWTRLPANIQVPELLMCSFA
jgi:hypothetical protein